MMPSRFCVQHRQDAPLRIRQHRIRDADLRLHLDVADDLGKSVHAIDRRRDRGGVARVVPASAPTDEQERERSIAAHDELSTQLPSRNAEAASAR